jgi:hypothetical protein
MSKSIAVAQIHFPFVRENPANLRVKWIKAGGSGNVGLWAASLM